MRIGEILLKQKWIGEDDLAIALADQQIAMKRTCSLLIVRGVLEPDQAARALAEQFGLAAALVKHLDNRDQALAKLLPSNIARQYFALPLGRMRDGEIVICVRDPKPQMQALFERVLNKAVLITVAAAHSLEPLIDMTYPPVVTQDFGVRFARPSTQPANVPRAPSVPNVPPAPTSFAAGTVRSSGVIEEEFDVNLDSGPVRTAATPPAEMPETFTVVDLDDAGVKKDFDQPFDTKTLSSLPPGAGAPSRPSTLPPLNVTRPPAKKP